MKAAAPHDMMPTAQRQEDLCAPRHQSVVTSEQTSSLCPYLLANHSCLIAFTCQHLRHRFESLQRLGESLSF